MAHGRKAKCFTDTSQHTVLYGLTAELSVICVSFVESFFFSWTEFDLCFFSSFPSGDRCEFDWRQGRCMPGVCHNGGTCRELSGGGFRCECPAGGYERPYCTVTARTFQPKSFVMFRGLRQRFHLSISLT